MVESFNEIEKKLAKSFKAIREDISGIKESIDKINENFEETAEETGKEQKKIKEEQEDIKQEIKQLQEKAEKKHEREEIPEIEKLAKNITDLTEYISELKQETNYLKKQIFLFDKKSDEKSQVKNLIEFSELKQDISELKDIIENIKIPVQIDYSKDISELKENFEQVDSKFSELRKEIQKQIKNIKFPIQKDYSSDINELAKEIGEIKGSLISRKYLKRETGKIDEKFSEKISLLEKKQEQLEIATEKMARQPLVLSLKQEIKQLKEQAEQEAEKQNEEFSEIKAENKKLREEIEQQNSDLRNEISVLKGRLTRLYTSAPEERKKIIEDERVKEKTKENAYKIIKFLIILIPIVLISFVIYSNFLASKDFNYFYDIGSQADAKTSYLTPIARISDINKEVDINYRNITNNGLVYFDVPIPRGSNNITAEIMFKDNFPKKSKMLIGARNDTNWSYVPKEVYNETLFKNSTDKWLTTSTSFDLKDLYIKDGKLNVYISIPHLSRNATQNYTIPIDWINITVHKDGFKI
ncbi:hypothetical protein FJZ19_02910 [Candidatus Pacearchaeota archaeon]|nr:hypothetical protein [Candidatus Pacearchaeota archaeon]